MLGEYPLGDQQDARRFDEIVYTYPDLSLNVTDRDRIEQELKAAGQGYQLIAIVLAVQADRIIASYDDSKEWSNVKEYSPVYKLNGKPAGHSVALIGHRLATRQE